jgi:hypothetical protein
VGHVGNLYQPSAVAVRLLKTLRFVNDFKGGAASGSDQYPHAPTSGGLLRSVKYKVHRHLCEVAEERVCVQPGGVGAWCENGAPGDLLEVPGKVCQELQQFERYKVTRHLPA